MRLHAHPNNIYLPYFANTPRGVGVMPMIPFTGACETTPYGASIEAACNIGGGCDIPGGTAVIGIICTCCGPMLNPCCGPGIIICGWPCCCCCCSCCCCCCMRIMCCGGTAMFGGCKRDFSNLWRRRRCSQKAGRTHHHLRLRMTQSRHGRLSNFCAVS